jgi:hypothetical protein
LFSAVSNLRSLFLCCRNIIVFTLLNPAGTLHIASVAQGKMASTVRLEKQKIAFWAAQLSANAGQGEVFPSLTLKPLEKGKRFRLWFAGCAQCFSCLAVLRRQNYRPEDPRRQAPADD